MNDKLYYRLKDLSISNYMNAEVFYKYIISNANDKLIQDNIFRYGTDFFTNIPMFYKLCIIHKNYHVFEKLVSNLTDISNLINQFGTPVKFDKTKHYVYIFNCFTKLKIGHTSNILERLKQISYESNEVTQCLSMYEYNTKKDAYLIEQMLINKFSKYKIKGEYFNNDPNIVDIANKLLNNSLIPVFM